jgi:methionine synthase II (cobalamin-independent)
LNWGTARALAYAEALAIEIIALTEIGASLIQIDEPAIIKYPDDWKIFEKAFAKLAAARDKSAKEGRRLELALYVYFHDPAPLYEKLIALPVVA